MGWSEQGPSHQLSSQLKVGRGGWESLGARRGGEKPCHRPVFLCSHGFERIHKHTPACRRWEGWSEKQGGRAKQGETKEVGSLSFSSIPPAVPSESRAPAGTLGEGQQPHSAAPSLTEGRKGAAGAASMLYCFPPGTLFLRERPKWYSGGKEGAAGIGEGSLSAQASAPGPSTLTHRPGPSLQPHLPPGKQQEEQRRRRGWRREEGGKEPEPEPPEGDGVGGLRPMTGAGSQPRGMAEGVSKTRIIKDTVPQKIGPWWPPPQEEASWGGKLG